jgi:nucleotide-binding universal stress UspA family protein
MTAPSLRLREILFATDFSPAADHAFGAALALAQHFEARVHLLHVVHHPREEDSARARLEAFARERAEAGQVVVAVTGGHPAHEIVAYAGREKVDLVVMGTHGRTGLSHVLVGSVAEAVVRHAPCQVLTIRAQVDMPVEESARGPERAVESRESPANEAHTCRQCIVCALASDELVCGACKARIQTEVLYRKLGDQKAGR